VSSTQDPPATRSDWSVAAWAVAPAQLETALADRLPAQALTSWRVDRDRVRSDPRALVRLFPTVARTVGRAALHPDDPTGLLGTVDDLARAVLLLAAGHPAQDLPTSLYRCGDAAERRGVLRALAHLDVPAAATTALLQDALRTNDTRLVAAALGPAADVLDAETWRQAVLKCLFVGVPLTCVHRLAGRADDTLAEMAARYVAERVSAGRDVPSDVGAVLPPGHPALSMAGLDDARHTGVPDRLAAATRARALLGTARTVPEPEPDPSPRET